MDCGAYVGFASHYFLNHNPDCRVVAVEPVKEHFELARRNLAGFGNRVTLIRAAVWPEPSSLEIVRPEGGNEWGAAVRPSGIGKSEVPAVTVPQIMRSAGWERIDLLKIDVEGAEAHIFSSPDCREWLAKCGAVAIELHGEKAERAFFDALSGFDYEKKLSRELTIVTRIRPRTGGQVRV